MLLTRNIRILSSNTSWSCTPNKSQCISPISESQFCEDIHRPGSLKETPGRLKINKINPSNHCGNGMRCMIRLTLRCTDCVMRVSWTIDYLCTENWSLRRRCRSACSRGSRCRSSVPRLADSCPVDTTHTSLRLGCRTGLARSVLLTQRKRTTSSSGVVNYRDLPISLTYWKLTNN